MRYSPRKRDSRSNRFLRVIRNGIIIVFLVCLGAYLVWRVKDVDFRSGRDVDNEALPSPHGNTWQERWNRTRYLFVLYLLW